MKYIFILLFLTSCTTVNITRKCRWYIVGTENGPKEVCLPDEDIQHFMKDKP